VKRVNQCEVPKGFERCGHMSLCFVAEARHRPIVRATTLCPTRV
jgi:hypothetical protein